MAPDTEEDPFQNFAALISELVEEVEGSVVLEWACTEGSHIGLTVIDRTPLHRQDHFFTI